MYHRWEFLFSSSKAPFKKMFTEVVLILPLYLTLFFIWWQFRHVMKIMSDVENILNDVADTPKEGIEQHEKQKSLESVISKGKAHLLGEIWTYEWVN